MMLVAWIIRQNFDSYIPAILHAPTSCLNGGYSQDIADNCPSQVLGFPFLVRTAPKLDELNSLNLKRQCTPIRRPKLRGKQTFKPPHPLLYCRLPRQHGRYPHVPARYVHSIANRHPRPGDDAQAHQYNGWVDYILHFYSPGCRSNA
jgi:hypothetical protein